MVCELFVCLLRQKQQVRSFRHLDLAVLWSLLGSESYIVVARFDRWYLRS